MPFTIAIWAAKMNQLAGLNMIYQFWVHTEHIGHLGFLEKIFITPMNHGIHHAKNKEYIDMSEPPTPRIKVPSTPKGKGTDKDHIPEWHTQQELILKRWSEKVPLPRNSLV